MDDINDMMKYSDVNGFEKHYSRKKCSKRKSTMKSLGNLITNDDVNQQDGKENSAHALENVKQPSPIVMFNARSKPIWSGIFKINSEVCLKVDAHLSCKAFKKVEECSRSLQPVLEVVKLPRLQVWPKGWVSSGPTDIGLYFFPSNSRSNEVSDELMNEVIKTDSALKVTAAIADLLIFPSVLLPEQNHLCHGKYYLWGLFRRRKDISDKVVLGGEQNGSTCVVPVDEGGQQEQQHLPDQADESQAASSEKIPCAMNDSHGENPPLVEGTSEAQIDEAMDSDIVVLGGEQNGSAHAMPVGEGGQQEHHLSDQIDEAQPASSELITFAMNENHIENPPLVERTGEAQIDEAMESVTGECLTTFPGSCLSGATKQPNSPKAVSNCSVHHPEQVSHPGDTFTSSSTKPNVSSVAAQLAEMTGLGQSCSVYEAISAKLFGFGVDIAQNPPRVQELIQDVATEGTLLVSEPAAMVTTDSVSGNSPALGAGLNPGTHHQKYSESEPPQPDVEPSQACLELFPVTVEQMGLAAPGAGTSNIMEVDLELSLGMPLVLHL